MAWLPLQSLGDSDREYEMTSVDLQGEKRKEFRGERKHQNKMKEKLKVEENDFQKKREQMDEEENK